MDFCPRCNEAALFPVSRRDGFGWPPQEGHVSLFRIVRTARLDNREELIRTANQTVETSWGLMTRATSRMTAAHSVYRGPLPSESPLLGEVIYLIKFIEQR